MEGTRPRYLDAASVMAAMPPVEERLALAERTLTALVGEADLPPKIGVHPRQDGSFAHAMPAALLPRDGADLLGIKWVTGFHENPSMGLPAIDATVLLNDPGTGRLRAVLDGAGITAERTAAVSGVAIARFGPTAAGLGGRVPRVALIGAGVQGRSHLAVLGHVLPGATVAIFDRHADRAGALAAAARETPGIGGAAVAETARAAVADADVVVTAASFTTPDRRQAMTADWLRDDALVVAVDYATMLHGDVARSAGLFLVDERGQFTANRDAGQFDGYPDPAATLGEAILADTARPSAGRVVVSHLGVGLADVVFGDAILARALELGLGQELGGSAAPA
jgi:ornithine cyclodeaminase/alanine dehydrogenase-like protein (mu-crystallin family)